jgi:hypothetical protein
MSIFPVLVAIFFFFVVVGFELREVIYHHLSHTLAFSALISFQRQCRAFCPRLNSNLNSPIYASCIAGIIGRYASLFVEESHYYLPRLMSN